MPWWFGRRHRVITRLLQAAHLQMGGKSPVSHGGTALYIQSQYTATGYTQDGVNLPMSRVAQPMVLHWRAIVPLSSGGTIGYTQGPYGPPGYTIGQSPLPPVSSLPFFPWFRKRVARRFHACRCR